MTAPTLTRPATDELDALTLARVHALTLLNLGVVDLSNESIRAHVEEGVPDDVCTLVRAVEVLIRPGGIQSRAVAAVRAAAAEELAKREARPFVVREALQVAEDVAGRDLARVARSGARDACRAYAHAVLPGRVWVGDVPWSDLSVEEVRRLAG